ncbi:MAG: CDP-diacylglycerol--glycerol-3-phosphate 3-phosphatidyltransferase [Clostridia bacterium]|nr:CDP-diacylglycerol--glycerol-3-phosphate 3-phosphatidyltransferase [Clostridia bacterium]
MQDNQIKTQRIMNLPNILSIVRMILVPVFMASILYMGNIEIWGFVVPAAIFALTSLTDMLDGKIARKYNLITDFGKFLDPLADKFMVFGALISLLAAPAYAEIRMILVWVAAIVMLRELGVTSLRLVVASRGVVVAASIWGKMKTVTQIFSILMLILEPTIPFFDQNHILSYVAMAAMAITTVGSGVTYLASLWPYVSGKK